MGTRADLILRFAASFAALFLLFALEWRPDLQHFDFQVWEAAVNMVPNGGNPYDPVALNTELQAHPDRYGSSYDNGDFYMYLSNPPTWLATVRTFGSSALAISLAGAILLYGSIVVLTKDRPLVDAMCAIAGTTMFALESPAASSFLLGQWGFFLAGLIGVQLVARSRSWSGLPTAFLAAKPHIAFAVGIVQLVRPGLRVRLLRLAVPYAVLTALTVVFLGPMVWPWFVEAMVGGNTHPPTTLPDMSLGTLTPLLPWRSLGLFGVLIGLGLSSMISWKWRDRDASVVLFASLAVAVYLSGHAFMHDWMWLPLVPVALRWSPAATIVSTIGVAQMMSLSHRFEDQLPHLQPAIGLVVTGALVLIAFRSDGDSTDQDIDPQSSECSGQEDGPTMTAASRLRLQR